MKRTIFLLSVCCVLLSGCGKIESGDDQTSKVKTTTKLTTTSSETTSESTTTTTTVTSEETTTTTAETTTAQATTTTVRTFNTEWYPNPETMQFMCYVDKVVYAAPTRESEQIGNVDAEKFVNVLGYANSIWYVIEWDDGIGFMETYEVYESWTPTELPPEPEPEPELSQMITTGVYP